MRITGFQKREDRKGSVLLSLGVHVVVIALIASITFTYKLELFGPREATPTERIQYVAVAPKPSAPEGTGGSTNPKDKPKKLEPKPAQLLAPSVIPTALPPIPPVSENVGAVNGTANGTGGGAGGAGIATGLAPTMPDSRIQLLPSGLRMPLTIAQRNDSAVKAIYLAYRQAEIEAESHKGKNPRDWTFEKGGNKYGVDSSWIYLGKFKLPSAILAALPFNYGGVDGRRIIDGRNASWIQNDIYTHSQGLSEDDFRAAIKRIRERVDREKKEAEDAKARPAGSAVP